MSSRPGGTPEGENGQDKSHRCYNRTRDFFKAWNEGNPFMTVPGPLNLLWRCIHSKQGEEPTDPFYYLQLDPPKGEVKLE